MKIWQRTRGSIGLLSCQKVMTFGFADVAIFNFTLVTVAMVTGNEYGLDCRCIHKDSILNTTVSCCVNGKFRDSHL